MNALFRVACLLALVAAGREPQFQNGDVVLQASTSQRSALIRKASRSPYSHTGVVEVAPEGVFVIEAVQPVKRTPLRAWLRRGEGGRYTLLRPRDLDEATRAKVVAAAKAELGKPYDATYRWDDERLYCSELVVKAFARGAGVEVGLQEEVGSLALSRDELALAAKLGVAASQTLVTPGSLADDAHFVVVHSDFE